MERRRFEAAKPCHIKLDSECPSSMRRRCDRSSRLVMVTVVDPSATGVKGKSSGVPLSIEAGSYVLLIAKSHKIRQILWLLYVGSTYVLSSGVNFYLSFGHPFFSFIIDVHRTCKM